MWVDKKSIWSTYKYQQEMRYFSYVMLILIKTKVLLCKNKIDVRFDFVCKHFTLKIKHAFLPNLPFEFQ